eukprot:4328154-Amphidinium_carterae.1
MTETAWASALPTQPSLVICNRTLQFAVRRQLMYPSNGQGEPCRQWKHRPDAAGLVTPHRCSHTLDAFSHHVQLCCKFLHTGRHNAVRDLIQRFAQALSETTETPRTDETHLAAKRGHERADLHLVSPGGHDQYIDIRITTIPPLADVQTHLLGP